MPLPNSRNQREYDKFLESSAGDTAIRVVEVSGGGAAVDDVNLIQLNGTALDQGTGIASLGTLRVVLADDQPVVNVNDGGNSTVLSGSQTVVTAGVPLQLIVASTPSRGVSVQADVANTGNILVGDVGSQDVTLFPGDSVSLDIDDLNKVYIDSTVNGEGVAFLGSV